MATELGRPPWHLEDTQPKAKMKTKWIEMSTVYAGPFIKNCNIGAVKKMFNSLGPVQSITLVLETYMHFWITPRPRTDENKRRGQ